MKHKTSFYVSLFLVHGAFFLLSHIAEQLKTLNNPRNTQARSF